MSNIVIKLYEEFKSDQEKYATVFEILNSVNTKIDGAGSLNRSKSDAYDVFTVDN